jgi:hypothetical protein
MSQIIERLRKEVGTTNYKKLRLKINNNSMQKLILLLSFFTSSQLFSQNIKSVDIKKDTSTTITNVNQNYPITISIKKGEEQVVHDRDFYLSELERIDIHIKSIDTKIKYVLENEIVPSEWLNEMNRVNQELFIEKSNILQKLNQQ